MAKKKSSAGRRGRRLPLAPTPDRIKEIQAALGRAGYYPEEPSGKWDAATVDSMKRFQQAQGLTPSGKIGALTLQKLGLGSDIAGLAAPRLAFPPDAAHRGTATLAPGFSRRP